MKRKSAIFCTRKNAARTSVTGMFKKWLLYKKVYWSGSKKVTILYRLCGSLAQVNICVAYYGFLVLI